MKRKHRFLLVKLERSAPLSEAEARVLVEEAVLEALGERGASQAQARLRWFNAKEQLALVYCSLEGVEPVISAFALKRYFGGKDAALRLQKVFGTLKKAEGLFPDAPKPGQKG